MEHDIAPNIAKTPFSCTRDSLTIRGHIYRAAQPGKPPVIILSHGFLGNATHIVTYAEALAKIGYVVFTFDFNGGGPESTSSGKSVDMTVLTEKADLLAVIKYISNKP